jgi:hypothetical protein
LAIYSSKPAGIFTWTRCKPDDVLSSPYPSIKNVTTNTGSVPNSVIMVGMCFQHYGSVLEIEFTANAASTFLLKVDGEYTTLTPYQCVANTNYIWKFDFGSANDRKIEYIGYNMVPTSVWTGETDSINTTVVSGPLVMCYGDSWTGGPFCWPLAFGDALGLDNVWASGAGGSGAIATNGGTRKTLEGRFLQDVVPYNPAMLVIFSGTNDAGIATQSQIYDAYLSLYRLARARLPDALIFAAMNTPAGWSLSANNYQVLNCMDAMKQAAADAGIAWLPFLELPLVGTAAPQSGTVYEAVSGGGATMIKLAPVGIPVGATVEVGTGTTRERLVVKAISHSPQRTQCTIEACKHAHAVGEPWTHVGPSFFTGKGNTSTPTGYGNSDVLLDGTNHPNLIGYASIGRQMAALVYNAIWGS